MPVNREKQEKGKMCGEKNRHVWNKSIKIARDKTKDTSWVFFSWCCRYSPRFFIIHGCFVTDDVIHISIRRFHVFELTGLIVNTVL